MKRIFLLGGRDLEMLTIESLLSACGEPFCDNHLSWHNAALSAYQSQLNEEDMFYGIELSEDVVPPEHYVRIDHHNDYAGKKSSLEQVADLLNVTLNRWQKLVAANDSAYIDGMKALGATDEEILSIRKADRNAQGVTEEEELLAQKAIDENLTKHGDLLVVKALMPIFSPICDRLYPYRHLLVYTKRKLVFYGEGQPQLVARFQKEIKTGEAFYGGGEKGFFGLADGHFSADEIMKYVESIIKIITYGV